MGNIFSEKVLVKQKIVHYFLTTVYLHQAKTGRETEDWWLSHPGTRNKHNQIFNSDCVLSSLVSNPMLKEA